MIPSISQILLLSTTLLGSAISATPLDTQTITSAPIHARPSNLPRQIRTGADINATTTITTSIFPGGVAQSTTNLQRTIPLQCIDGCFPFLGPYYGCFRPETIQSTEDIDTCDSVCNQQYYDGLSACLNCVVANGNERRLGWTPDDPEATASALPNGRNLIVASEGSAWLQNVTDFCGGRGVALEGATTVTAVPTTTGPYSASWSSGATISRTQWTGLAQYSPPLYTYTATLTVATSSTSAGAGSKGTEQSGRWLALGVVLAWAVL